MVAWLGKWFGKSPFEIMDWWSDEILFWHNESVQVHNKLHDAKEGN